MAQAVSKNHRRSRGRLKKSSKRKKKELKACFCGQHVFQFTPSCFWSGVVRLMSPLPLMGSLELAKPVVAGPTSLPECDRQTVCKGKQKNKIKGNYSNYLSNTERL